MVRTLWNKENCIVPVEYSVVDGSPTVKCSLTGEQIAELMHYNHVILEVVEGTSVTGVSNVSLDENNEVRFTYLDNDGNNVGIAVGDGGAEVTDVTTSDNTIVYTTADMTADPVVVECNKDYSEVASLISSYSPIIFLKEIKDGSVTNHVAYGSGIVEDSSNIVTVNFELLETENEGVAIIINFAISHFDDESIEVNVAVSDIGGGSGLEHLLDGTADGSLMGSRCIATQPNVGAFQGGTNTEASNINAFAFGDSCSAVGERSVALGHNTAANGTDSIALGYQTSTTGKYSQAQNSNTHASRYAQTVIGEYNAVELGSVSTRGQYVLIIGNGTDIDNRSNALAVKWDGGIVLADGTELTVADLAGIKNGNFVVTFISTDDGATFTCNKSYDEINNAMINGLNIIVIVDISGEFDIYLYYISNATMGFDVYGHRAVQFVHSTYTLDEDGGLMGCEILVLTVNIYNRVSVNKQTLDFTTF